MNKYYIFHLVCHSDEFFRQSPDEEVKSQKEIDEFILSWKPEVKLIMGAHCLNLNPDWDWIGVFAVDELSDWEAFREEYKRRFFGRIKKNLSIPAVSHKEFHRATERIEHYQKLRQKGLYAGSAETKEDVNP